MQLRCVNKNDIDLLFSWVNDIEVRKQSYSSEPILYDQHSIWFHENLKKQIPWYILEEAENSIGVIRFDLMQEGYKINYLLDSKFRGKGFGKRIISLGLEKLSENLKLEIVVLGFVKKENLASISCFISNGFNQESHSIDSYIFKKKIPTL